MGGLKWKSKLDRTENDGKEDVGWRKKTVDICLSLLWPRLFSNERLRAVEYAVYRTSVGLFATFRVHLQL